ncbi:MAG: hypothetical protein J6C90_01070 [Clostridia bacterium]|nr:hypothetical protein [Clostridia bacterium]
MELVKIIAIGLITCFVCLFVKQIKPEIAVLIGLAGSVMMLIMSVDMVITIAKSFKSIFIKTGITDGVLAPVFKIIGIGYLCEFSANLCYDTGHSSIAEKVLLAGKVMILLVSLPIINTLIDTILGLL